MLSPSLAHRMPALARRTPLTPTLAVFETFTMEKEPRQYRDSSSGQMRTREYNVRSWAAAPTTVGAARVPRRPSEAEGVQYRRLCLQNATCFNNLEAAHPINFFEQRDVCMNCGAERFTVTNPSICCASTTASSREVARPPRDGRGAFCSLCVASPRRAMRSLSSGRGRSRTPAGTLRDSGV